MSVPDYWKWGSKVRKPIRLSAYILAAAFFMIGFLFYGTSLWHYYIHEFGHVFFGGGKIVAPNLVYGNSGSFLGHLGGGLFIYLFGLGSTALGLRLRKPWIGSLFWGVAHMEWLKMYGSTDLAKAGVSGWGWTIFSVLFFLFSWALLAVTAVLNDKRLYDYLIKEAKKTKKDT